MRKAEFEVPAELMPEFTEALVETELKHSLTGVNGEGEIVIEVQYKRDEADTVNELEEQLDNLLERADEEEEDD